MTRHSLNRQIATGYVWNLVARIAYRLIGLVSLLILARLLSPEDFGIAALATIVMTLALTFTELNSNKYLLRLDTLETDSLASAWSLDLSLKCIAALVIAAGAPFLSELLAEPALREVLPVCALLLPLRAAANAGLVEYERKLDYRPLTQLSVSAKLISFPPTLAIAWYFQSYWALVIGIVISDVVTTAGSYWLHPYRPYWSTRYWRQQWLFSRWMILTSVSGAIRSRVNIN